MNSHGVNTSDDIELACGAGCGGAAAASVAALPADTSAIVSGGGFESDAGKTRGGAAVASTGPPFVALTSSLT